MVADEDFSRVMQEAGQWLEVPGKAADGGSLWQEATPEDVAWVREQGDQIKWVEIPARGGEEACWFPTTAACEVRVRENNDRHREEMGPLVDLGGDRFWYPETGLFVDLPVDDGSVDDDGHPADAVGDEADDSDGR